MMIALRVGRRAPHATTNGGALDGRSKIEGPSIGVLIDMPGAEINVSPTVIARIFEDASVRVLETAKVGNGSYFTYVDPWPLPTVDPVDGRETLPADHPRHPGPMPEHELRGLCVSLMRERDHHEKEVQAEREKARADAKEASAMLIELQGRMIEVEDRARRLGDDLTAANLGRQAASDQVRHLNEVLAPMRRSNGFLTGVLEDLANEVGLAREDMGGILRAVRARDGAAMREKTLRREFDALHERHFQLAEGIEPRVVRLEAELESARSSLKHQIELGSAAAAIIQRIGKLVGANHIETVEAAVERVMASRQQLPASVEASRLGGKS